MILNVIYLRADLHTVESICRREFHLSASLWMLSSRRRTFNLSDLARVWHGDCYPITMPLPPVQAGNRKVAIAVDLSDESAYAVRWAVVNYLRSDDMVILLHVQPTNVLYGADWGDIDQSIDTSDEEPQQQKLAEEFDTLTSHKIAGLAEPLVEAGISYKIHVVKDHDMKERICLEAERLGVNAMVMGSRGFGAVKKASRTRLGSVSDYCVHHCECPVMVVRFPEDEMEAAPFNGEVSVAP